MRICMNSSNAISTSSSSVVSKSFTIVRIMENETSCAQVEPEADKDWNWKASYIAVGLPGLDI